MNRSIVELVPPYIRQIDPYQPGLPVEEVERRLDLRAVKLASNENPLGPSPKAVEAARAALAEAHRYPDGGGYYLRQELAARLGVPMDNVILGAGSTDLIDVVARTLLSPADAAVTSAGSFPMYSIAVRSIGAQLITRPLRDYTFDLPALLDAATPRTKLFFLANPNNPTGTMFTASALERFLQELEKLSPAVVVLDEAYFEYVQAPDYSRSLELVRSGAQLLVLRTFSKVHGLAGLRIGYGIGPAPLLAEMNKVRSPFNTSNVAQAAARAALDDAEHLRRSVETNRLGLQQLLEGLDRLGLRPVPSVANFVLVELGRAAGPVADALLREGVIVRPMGWMGFPQAVRVSVGTAEENRILLAALDRVLSSDGEPRRKA
jgi:histidinol-phosphate aminotransferase